MRTIILPIILSVLVGGCAIGNTHRYDLGDAEFRVKSDKSVAVASLDMRPYVRSGDKSANFVGLMRGGFGNPFDVTTGSGRTLAEDMTTSLVASFKKTSVNATPVNVPPSASASDARKTLLKADADRFVLFLIREWKTDTYVNTGLIRDVSLKVLGKDGAELADKTIKGRENLGGSMVPSDARGHAEKAFRRTLEEAVNDPSVTAALQ